MGNHVSNADNRMSVPVGSSNVNYMANEGLLCTDGVATTCNRELHWCVLPCCVANTVECAKYHSSGTHGHRRGAAHRYFGPRAAR